MVCYYEKHMSLFGTLRNKQARVGMVVDVGAYSMKAIMFDTDGTAPPRVIKKIFTKLPVSGDSIRVTRFLHELLFNAAKVLGKVPDAITIGVGPPFAPYVLKPLVARLEGKRHSFEGMRLTEIYQNLVLSGSDTFGEFPHPLAVYANGWHLPLTELRGHAFASVKELAFPALFLQLIPEAMEALVQTQKMLGGIPIEYVPLALAYQEAIKKVFRLQDFFLIDVGERHTMLMRVREGAIVQSVSTPHGLWNFAKAISKTHSLSMEEAVEIRNHYVEESIDRVPKGTQETLSKEMTMWRSAFMMTLDRFYRIGPFSEEVILCGGGARLPEIRAFLLEGEWMRGFSHFDRPTLRVVEGRALFEGDSLGGHLQGPEEFGLGSLIIYSLYYAPLF